MNPSLFQPAAPGRVIKAPTGYHYFVPAPLPPDIKWTPDLITVLSEADRALGQLAGLGRTMFNPRLLILPFCRREAVLSSRIEGTRATLPDLYAYEAIQLPLFESPPDVQEVYNYVKALEYGLDRLEKLPLSLRLIREVHRELMTGVRGEYQTPGEFRRSPNWIGPAGANLNNAAFVPPAVEEMKNALAAFEEYLHAEPTLPPLIRLGLIHYQFEAIHPFLDGNGRIGRLLIVLLLVTWQLLPAPLLYLSAYFETHRQSYYDLLLAVSQRGDWEDWLIFFLQGITSQARDAVLRADRLQILREYYRQEFQGQRAVAKLLQVIDLLFLRPVVTIQQLETEIEVTFTTANKYVSQLQDKGILREITGQARNRVFVAEAILRAIEEPIPPDSEGYQ